MKDNKILQDEMMNDDELENVVGGANLNSEMQKAMAEHLNMSNKQFEEMWNQQVEYAKNHPV